MKEFGCSDELETLSAAVKRGEGDGAVFVIQELKVEGVRGL